MSAPTRKKLASLRKMLAHYVRVTEEPRDGTGAHMLNSSWLQRKALEWVLDHPDELVAAISQEREDELKRAIVAESVARHANLRDDDVGSPGYVPGDGPSDDRL